MVFMQVTAAGFLGIIVGLISGVVLSYLILKKADSLVKKAQELYEESLEVKQDAVSILESAEEIRKKL